MSGGETREGEGRGCNEGRGGEERIGDVMRGKVGTNKNYMKDTYALCFHQNFKHESTKTCKLLYTFLVPTFTPIS